MRKTKALLFSVVAASLLLAAGPALAEMGGEVNLFLGQKQLSDENLDDLEDFTGRKTSIEEHLLGVEHEQAELRSQVVQRDLAIQQVAGAEAVLAGLRDRLENPDFATKQAILRLAVEKIVVTGHRLEIHMALPVSGSFDLTLDWGASLYASRTRRRVVDSHGAKCGRLARDLGSRLIPGEPAASAVA